jgi:hypothetical protein
MSVDVDKIKNKLDDLRNKNSKGSNLWKPDEGKQTIRIVPYRYQMDFPFLELYFHYELPGQPNYLSPISFDDPEGIGDEELVERSDPIAEFAEEMRRKKGQEGYEMWKTLYPKRRTYAPVIVRGEEEAGVRFWGFGKTIFEELLEKFADPDWGDLSDPKEGRDIKLTYIPRSQSDTDFPKTRMSVNPNKTPLAEDKEQLKKFYESQTRITDVFDVPTEDELSEALEEYLQAKDEDEDEEPKSETASSDNGETNVETEESTDSADFEEEFDEMFGND